MNTDMAIWGGRALSVLRIMTGLLFLAHGLPKIFGFPPGVPHGQAPLMSLSGVAGILEFVGGGLIILGLFTRPAAFVLSGEMAVAYFMVHAPKGFYPILNGGELAILYCFILLYLSVAGAGSWSIDARRAVNPKT
jgi:putative oxidoreductase